MRPHRAFIPILSLALLAIVAQTVPASTQGFGWFGGSQDDRYPRQNPWSGGERQSSWFGQRQYTPQVSAYSDRAPSCRSVTGRRAPFVRRSTGRYVPMVRLCDGAFPMQRHATPPRSSFATGCPARDPCVTAARSTRACAERRALRRPRQALCIARRSFRLHLQRQGPVRLAKIDIKSYDARPGDIVATGDNHRGAPGRPKACAQGP